MRPAGTTELSVHAGYFDLLVFAGLDVLHCERFGTTKGDLCFAVRRGDQYGICVIGWGSCEGCDVLKALLPPPGATKWDPDNLIFVEQFAYETAADTVWGTRDELADHFTNKQNTLLQWYGAEAGFYDALHELLTHIPE